MKKYNVIISETLRKSIEVSAESSEEAEQKVNDSWHNSGIILDADDFDRVEFEAVEKPPEQIKVVLLEPEKLAKTVKIDASLEGMQAIVGGLIEAAYYFDEEVALVCNEEGKVTGLPLNRAIYDSNKNMIDIVAGPCFICDCSGENFGSLSDEQLKRYKEQFKYPENFIRVNNEIKAISFKPKEQNYDR